MNTVRGAPWRRGLLFWTIYFLLILLAAFAGSAARAQENENSEKLTAEGDDPENAPPVPEAPMPFTGYGGGPVVAAGEAEARGLRQFTRGEFPGDRIAWTIVGAVAALGLIAPGLLLFHTGWQGRSSAHAAGPQFFAAAAILSLAWAMWIYSLAFARSGASADATPGELTAGDVTKTDGNPWIGSGRHLFLQGMTSQLADDAPIYPLRRPNDRVPHLLFFGFHMMFFLAAAAPLAAVLRTRLSTPALCLFLVAWGTFVYAPIAYWTWGSGWASGALDTAGGLLAHVNVGFAAAAAALLWRGAPREDVADAPSARVADAPSARVADAPSAPTVVLGAVLFWAGSLLWSSSRGMAADGAAANAFVVTHLAACAGLAAWAGFDWLKGVAPSAAAFAGGAVGGLVAIAPASGYVAPESSMVIGVCGAVAARFALGGSRVRGPAAPPWRPPTPQRGLIAFHAVAGSLGVLLTGLFATASVAGVDGNEIPINGAIGGNPGQLSIQMLAIVASAALAFGGSFVLLAIGKVLRRAKPKQPVETSRDETPVVASAR